MNSPFMKQTFLFYIIILFLINIVSNLTFTLKSIEKICANSDEYINNYFSGDEELFEKYNELSLTDFEKNNDEKIIKLILLSKNSETEYEKEKLTKFKIYRLILLIIIIPFCIIIIIFEIHFLCRTSHIDNKKRKNEVDCYTYLRINPFGFFKYSCTDQKERINYFIEYKSQDTLYNIRSIIFFYILIFILMVGSTFVAILKFIGRNKTKTSVANMTCALMKFLYEMKNKPIRKSSFIGFENVNNFFANFSKATKIINEKLLTLKNSSNEIKILNTSWISSINKIQKKLSNQESMEFFFYGLPSAPDNLNFKEWSVDNISDVTKHLFQLKVIYNFYPVDIEGTTLYYINKFFNYISESINSELEKLEKKLSSQESNNKDNENNNIYQNVVSKFDNVLNLYINKFQDIYIEKIDKNLKNDLTDIYNFDLILVFVLILCITLSIILIKNVFNKNCYSYNGMISVLLMHLIFIFFILSAYQLIIFQNINTKIIYIRDVWTGIAFLFDSYNINYLNEHPIDNFENISLLIKENNKYNNLFYYLNYMFNNQGKISYSSETMVSPISYAELLTFNKEFDNLNNSLKSYDDNHPNDNLYKYSVKISDMIEGGLQCHTEFQDITDSGYLGSYFEDPLSYLSFANLRTRENVRKAPSYGFKNFDCDETWNVSTLNFAKWVNNKYYMWYYTNSNKYLCSSCTNHYSSIGSSRPPLLNFVEFTLEQAIGRYSDLKDTDNYAEYNALVYYFTAVEFLRNSSFIEHLQKMNNFNMELSDIQNKNFISLKKSVDSAKNIVNEYLNLLNYTGGDVSSAIYCKYLRQDLNFVLSEIKSGFLNNINNVSMFHILMDIVNIILSILMIIFYCLISYNLPYFQINNNQEGKIRKQNRSSINKMVKEKKNNGTFVSHKTIEKKNQKMLKMQKNNMKDNRQIIIKISGNVINNNNYNREKESYNKNENLNFNSQVNDSNIKFVDNRVKSDFAKKDFPIQNERLGDDYEAEFQSKGNIIGDLQINDVGVLKLNENK